MVHPRVDEVVIGEASSWESPPKKNIGSWE